MQVSELVTHEGFFHADDVMAGAILTTLFPEAKLFRSRKEELISPKPGRIVWDVGHTYDHGTSSYDHHQQDGAGNRENGVPYASFGLVWLNFGKQYLTKIGIDKKNIDVVWKIIDEKFVQPLDAHDTGHSKMLDPLDFVRAVSQKVPSQKYSKIEDKWTPSAASSEQDYYDKYMDMLPLARKRLYDYAKYITRSSSSYDARKLRKVSHYILALAIKKIANPNLNLSNMIHVKKFKRTALGLDDINVPRIGDLFKDAKDSIFKNLGVEAQFTNPIQRKILRVLITNENLFSSSSTSLVPMIDHAILSHAAAPDDQFKIAILKVIDYIVDFIRNYITSSYYAATGHEMVKEEIEKYIHQNTNDGTLILPGGADYVPVINMHNKMHPDLLVKSVIYPISTADGQRWNAKHMVKERTLYDTFRKFPADACGKTGDDIAKGLNLPLMNGKYVFCHNNGHLLIANDMNAALTAVKMSTEV